MPKKPEPELPSEEEELLRLRDTLWQHLELDTGGKQKLGIGAIAGQLIKVNERLAEIAKESKDEETNIADALAEARAARANRKPQTGRRGNRPAS